MSTRSQRYYIRKQTNAGPNKGKWRVHRPDGLSVSPPCESKAQAAHLCAAFELGRRNPLDGSRLGIEKNFSASAELPEDYSRGKFGVHVPARGHKRVGEA